jgi:NADH-quinone oxidoreductase subunit N
MHHQLPSTSGYLSDIMASLPYFRPEIYLVALFLVIIITDFLFDTDTWKPSRVIAILGILLVAYMDKTQFTLLLLNDGAKGHFIFNQMLILTQPEVKFKLLIDLLAFILIVYSQWDNKLAAHKKGLSDFYTILIGSVFGLHLMVMGTSMVSIYIGIELVSIASYLMVAYNTEGLFSTEAGLKYVLFGAASSAIMLFGISLLYAFTGNLNFFSPDFINNLNKVDPLGSTFGLLLVLVGIGFKLSFVPVHFWVPDVYEGAPTPVTAWLSTLPKIAGFALLINFLTPYIFFARWKGFDFQLSFSIVAILTMIAGNFAAIMQTNVKRMLAYSSIGHTGFAIMALVTYNESGISALIFYLAVYGIANIGSLLLASYFANNAEVTTLDGYKGLGSKYPLASICFVITLISLAGLPITAGFTGKLFVFSSVYGVYTHGHNIWMLLLLITGAVTTVVSLFYYIKIPWSLFIKKSDVVVISNKKSQNLLILASLLGFLIILLGLFPHLLY